MSTQVTKSVLPFEDVADLIEGMDISETTDLGDTLIHDGHLHGERAIVIMGLGRNGCVIKIAA